MYHRVQRADAAAVQFNANLGYKRVTMVADACQQKTLNPRGALPFRIGREACPIFLVRKFCRGLYFWIYLLKFTF